MLDRSVNKNYYWSNRTDQALIFTNYESAYAMCRKLKYNNPKPINLNEAVQLSYFNNKNITQKDSYNEYDLHESNNQNEDLDVDYTIGVFGRGHYGNPFP